jgi:hypothetical protein
MTARTHELQASGGLDSRPVELSVTYRQGDGELRIAVIAVDRNNLWAVYDIPAEAGGAATGVVVEHLTALDRLGEALGVLIPYVKDQIAFHNSDPAYYSPESPLPRPQEVDIARVRRDAKRALKAAEADRQRGSDPKNAEWLGRVRDLAEQQRAATDAERQAEQQPERQPLAA